ncbi:MAG: hypothetical protein DA446_03095 [Bacteroidetes bacterium]|jgi:hypothetical protein|nr:hypothetical protein [Bacteroidota bacterium]PTM15471.1 MAG: hypothetical protein DA443_03385 [Bacteroidota bacterium]PTM20499.1 MAG: hypothetical protein DA446_03095 [Bacteroidota bacterium]
MDIKLVNRSVVQSSRMNKSKYQNMKSYLDKLEPEGRAIEVKFEDRKELISYRNILYSYNRNTGKKVKSSVDSSNNTLFLYLD